MFLYVVCQQKYNAFIVTAYTAQTILLCHHSDTPNTCSYDQWLTVRKYAKLVLHRGPEHGSESGIQQLSPLLSDNLASVVMCDNL